RLVDQPAQPGLDGLPGRLAVDEGGDREADPLEHLLPLAGVAYAATQPVPAGVGVDPHAEGQFAPGPVGLAVAGSAGTRTSARTRARAGARARAPAGAGTCPSARITTPHRRPGGSRVPWFRRTIPWLLAVAEMLKRANLNSPTSRRPGESRDQC